MDALQHDTKVALESILEPREYVTSFLPAVGCELILTDRRLFLVREGRAFRPRTGVRSWPLDPTLLVRSTPTGSQPGRLLITSRGRTTSVFIGAEQHRAADLLVAEIKRRIHTRS